MSERLPKPREFRICTELQKGRWILQMLREEHMYLNFHFKQGFLYS